MKGTAIILARQLGRRGAAAAITATLLTALLPGVGAAQSGVVADKVSLRSSNGKYVCAEGGGGGGEDQRMFDLVMKPIIQTLASNLLKSR